MALDLVGRQKVVRSATTLGFVLLALFFLPPLLRIDDISAVGVLLAPQTSGLGEFVDACSRTIVVSIIVAFGSVAVSFIASMGTLGSTQGLSRVARILLVLPFFLGEAVIAFVVRLGFDIRSNLFHTTDWPAPAILLLIAVSQILRFGSLFTFVMASRLREIDRNYVEFVTVHMISRVYYIRDVVLPAMARTFQVCCSMAFAGTVVENTLAVLVFRASPGNRLELLSQWNERQYSLLSKTSPQLARDVGALAGSLELAATLILAGVVFITAGPLMRLAAMTISGRNREPARAKWLEVGTLGLLQFYSVSIVAAILVIVAMQWNELNGVLVLSLTQFGLTILLGILTSGAAAAVAALLAILCSLSWPNKFCDLSRTSVVAISAAVVLSAIPSIYLLLAVYDWSLAVLQAQFEIPAWALSHAATMTPLLFAFFVVTHFVVRVADWDFQSVHIVPVRQIVWLAFILRFRSVYALGAFCAFALIWNEHTINSAFSSSVPSFASVLNRALEGRAASVSTAAICAATSLLLGLICAKALSIRSRESGR